MTVIVPMPGTTLDIPAVIGYLGEHIADFKVPEYVAVSSTPLPRNPGGKLLKRRLREDVDWAAASAADRPGPPDPTWMTPRDRQRQRRERTREQPGRQSGLSWQCGRSFTRPPRPRRQPGNTGGLRTCQCTP